MPVAAEVSIPLRKVSRDVFVLTYPTDEAVSIPLRKVSRFLGFDLHLPAPRVSIPLRKVSRDDLRLPHLRREEGFHPSKEGFKVPSVVCSCISIPRFHPSKEGFKGARRQKNSCMRRRVSIPLRKVSRHGESALGKARSGFPSL